MRKMMWVVTLGVGAVGFLVGRASAIPDSHWPPRYSERSGLAMNCSAYVEVSVRAYRAGEHKADAVMEGLSRNCGALGNLWTAN